MKKISDHKFINTYEGGVTTEAEYYDSEVNEVKKFVLWNPKEKPEAWEYLNRVGNVFRNLCDTINELQITIKFIGETIHLETLIHQNTSEILMYLIKNWIARYVTTYEASYHLINEVLGLGHKGSGFTIKLENDTRIRNNFQLEKIRKKIHKLVTGKLKGTNGRVIVNLNNIVKHEGRLLHESIDELSWYELQKKWGLYRDEVDFKFDQGILIHDKKNGIKNHIIELSDKMVDVVIELLDNLDPIYEHKFAELRK